MYQLSAMVVLVCICLTASKIVKPASSYFTICHKSDLDISQCIKKSVTEAKPKLVKGIPELDLIPIDPLFIPRLELKDGSGQFNFKQILTNVNVYGLGKFKIENLKFDLKKNYMEVIMNTPAIDFVGSYEMEGKLLNLQIKGSGQCVLNFTNVRTTAFVQNEMYKKKGKDFIRNTSTKWDIDPKNASFNFTNLFNGDKTLGDATNTFLNENWKEAFKIYKNLPEEAFGTFFKEMSNRIYSHYPAEELFPE